MFLSHYYYYYFNALINMEKWIGLLYANVFFYFIFLYSFYNINKQGSTK